MTECRFCHSELNQNNTCDFCGAKAQDQQATTLRYGHTPYVRGDESLDYLRNQHIYTLYFFLHVYRKERSSYFDLLRTFKKSLDETNEFADNEKEAGEEYEFWTKKVWIAERIIADRLGYAPQRIDDKFLNSQFKKIKQYESKKHQIRKTKKEVST